MGEDGAIGLVHESQIFYWRIIWNQIIKRTDAVELVTAHCFCLFPSCDKRTTTDYVMSHSADFFSKKGSKVLIKGTMVIVQKSSSSEVQV